MTAPHPFRMADFAAGGLPGTPAPEDLSPDVLELDPPAVDLPAVRAVSPWQRLVETEPVRLWLWPVLVAVLGLLTAYGLVDDRVAPAWLALVEALLGVGGWQLIERVRAGVYSPRSAGQL